jgi:hypothetical protein
MHSSVSKLENVHPPIFNNDGRRIHRFLKAEIPIHRLSKPAGATLASQFSFLCGTALGFSKSVGAACTREYLPT